MGDLCSLTNRQHSSRNLEQQSDDSEHLKSGFLENLFRVQNPKTFESRVSDVALI
jgi:hypothetical protein